MYLSGLWAAHSTASLHTHIMLTNLTRPTKLFATQTCCRRTSCNSGLPPAGLPSCIPNLRRNAPHLSLVSAVIPGSSSLQFSTCRPPCTPNPPLPTIHGNSLLYFLNTPLCVKVNCNVSLQLTFTQLGVKINSKQNGVNFYTKWCNTRLLVATANIAEATACLVTRRSLHGPGSNFCHPPAHGVEICFVYMD